MVRTFIFVSADDSIERIEKRLEGIDQRVSVVIDADDKLSFEALAFIVQTLEGRGVPVAFTPVCFLGRDYHNAIAKSVR